MPNLISCDHSSDKIYIHSGITVTISSDFASPTEEPTGLTLANGNLISCDWGYSNRHPKIYIHEGITSTITESFDSPLDWPNGPSGLAFDGTNLISCSQNGQRIYIHSGITSTIRSDFASPSTAPSGLTYDGSNLISCDYDEVKIYIHSGITSSVSSSFASPSTLPYGLAFDGDNLISCDGISDTIYIHSGITSTITDSFNSPSTFPTGLTLAPAISAITTQATSDIGYNAAMGNGTIVSGGTITERGFEVVLSFSGSYYEYVMHKVAGFEGDVAYVADFIWEGTLTKTESEEGEFETGAFELELGYFNPLGEPSTIFNDKLFKCESYTNRAYMVSDGTTYYGEYVSFDTLCDAGSDIIVADDLSDGNPTVPIIPITAIEPIELLPGYLPFIWEPPAMDWPSWKFPPLPPWDIYLPELPPWVDIKLPELPSWEFPDYPSLSFVGDFYYKKPYTKRDLDNLRKKCIIYNKNSIEFALVLRHNMNVLREFFNMMTDYMDKEEFNDFTDLIPPQRLKELYLDPLEVNDFRDMINEFIRNTIDNNIAVNRNFKLIQDGLSDYETEIEDAYFREINSNIKTVTEDNPDVDRLKRVIDNLNQEVSSNFSNIMSNLKIIKARLL